MKLMYLTAVSVFALAAPAMAADPIAPTPASPTPVVDTTAYDWSGFYAGLNAGYGWGEIESDGAGQDVEGFVFGGQAGYNVDIDGFVLGVEGDIQWSGVDYEETVGGVTASTGIDVFGTVRARAGAAVGDFMPYVTGGLAYGRGFIEAESGGASVGDEQWHFGWAAGVGAEFAATDTVSIKAEYLYTDFADETYTITGLGSVDGGGHIHTIRAGVNFHF